MKVLYERVAGIDVHKEMIKVAIRSPGETPWTRTTEILEFRTFFGVLQEMARELRRRGVTHVVMEASGVYTEPVYYALCEQDFAQVAVINPAHAKALKGHKTDAKDCARLAELFECGLGGENNPGAKKKAITAIAHTLLKIAYQVLKTGTPYQEPGADFYTRRESPAARQAFLERQLQKLHPGCTITITVSPPEAALTPGA